MKNSYQAMITQMTLSQVMILLWAAVLSCTAISASSLHAANFFNGCSQSQFVPQWTKGDRWIVKTESIAKELSPKSAKIKRKAATQNFWIYKVVNTQDKVVNGNDIRFFHIMATNWRSKTKETGAYIFAGILNSSLKRVTSLSLIKSGWKNKDTGISIERDYTKMGPYPFPVINDYSPVPSSFPIFLNNKLMGDSTGIIFEVTKKIGVLPFARDVKQVITTSSKQDSEIIKMQLTSEQKKEMTTVVISRFDDNYEVKQIWHKDYPWFLYSNNGDFQAWLVKYKKSR